jgi:hypothetical protein
VLEKEESIVTSFYHPPSTITDRLMKISFETGPEGPELED